MIRFSVPALVTDRLERLGDRIRTARLRRAWSVAMLAAKAGINRNTLSAIEHGKPGTSVVALTSVLWALGLDGALESIADPDQDLHGKSLEAARRPKRARRGATETGYDF
jgi:ribosome-binding protein aMBF1 (putative translation factor)